MNAFFASVEQKANPLLRGKPVIVCGNPKGRSTVATASYEARPFGIKAGMPLGEARRRCPQAILVEGNPSKYVYTSLQILDILQEYSPQVEAYSIDEAFVDLSGTQRLLGPALRVAKSIKWRIRRELGLSCSMGIAPNKILAKLASSMEKPDGLVVIPKEKVSQILNDTPVERLCGVGEKITKILNSLGIFTCGQLQRYPIKHLESLFGKNALALQNMASGIDQSPVSYCFSEPKAKSMGHDLTLEKDIYNRSELKVVLFQLCEKVARRLRKGRYKARTVGLVLRYKNFTTYIRQKTVHSFLDQGKQIYYYAEELLKKFDPSLGIRMIGVRVSNLVQVFQELSLFPWQERDLALTKAVDSINDRYGEFTIYWAKGLKASSQST